MSSPDTWMPLYVGRYLADTGHLTVAQHGAYLLLLMQYWCRGPLPDDDCQLANMAKTEIKVWKKVIGPVVRQFFTVRDGVLHQKRADLELDRAKEITEKKRAAANTRWGGSKSPPPNGSGRHESTANGMHMHGKTDAPAYPPAMHPQSTSIAPAMQMECHPPVPPPDNILSFKGSVRASAREAPEPGNPASEADIPADPGLVRASAEQAIRELKMRAYPMGERPSFTPDEQRAALDAERPQTKAAPLKPDVLAALRRAAGYGA